MKRRLLSGAILLPLVVAAIVVGAWPYALLVTLAILLAGSEYVQMLKRKALSLSLVLIWAMSLLWIADAVWDVGRWLVPAFAWLTLVIAAWSLYRRKVGAPEGATTRWGLTLAGGVYLGLGGAYLVRVRALPDGLWWTLTAFPIIWIGESAAYAIGKRWGHHKMAPGISPGKSWEGYASEVVSGALTGLALGWLWPLVAGHALSLTPGKGMLLGLVLTLVTTLGDFFVSMIKREVNVKDSGTLIPGHGGVFDRIDSLLWTGIVTWTLVTLWV
jgi:phosphatidate cytidylyltransferase